MFKLLPLYAICFILAWMSNRNSIYDYKNNVYIYKEKFFYLLLILFAVLFAGLRTGYNDTYNYISGYELLNVEPGWLSSISWKLGDYPGYSIVRCWMKYAGFSSQSFIMFFSVFTIGVQLWFVHRYSNDTLLSVFLFFTIGCFGFDMAAIKQCVSISICLIAIDRLINRKYIAFVIIVLIAVTFHPFSILFLVAPFLQFRPWSANTRFLLLGIVAGGLSMHSWLGKALDFASIMGKDYDPSLIVGEGVSLFRLVVVWAPIVLSVITSAYWRSINDKAKFMMMNLTMINAGLMFFALFGNPIYFGRLANYFLIFQVLSIPYILDSFGYQSRRFLSGVMAVCYFGYCYYGYGLHGKFDSAFTSVDIWYYLSHIWG